jgi:hypothetical protein
MHGLALDDELRGEEPEVQDDRRGEDQHGAVKAELPPALDHLRHAERGSLNGVEANQGEANDDSGCDGDACPQEVEPEEHHHSAED